jgi:hypothetical protein
MAKIMVTCVVRSYNVSKGDDMEIKVYTHGTDNSKVILEVGDQTITVMAKWLIAALENCINTASTNTTKN